MVKTDVRFYTLLTVIFGVCLYGLYLYFGRMDFGLLFLSVLGTAITILIIAAVIGIVWRAKNGVDLLATLETDPAKVKERMLVIMQFGHPEGIRARSLKFRNRRGGDFRADFECRRGRDAGIATDETFEICRKAPGRSSHVNRRRFRRIKVLYHTTAQNVK